MDKQIATERFGMRINAKEKKQLAELAKNMRRSQADTIRILISNAYSLANMPKTAIKA